MPHPPRLLLGAGAALALVLVCGPGAAAVEEDAVTLVLSKPTLVGKVAVFTFTGRVGSGTRGEQVVVLRRDCGVPGLRLLAATRTRAGGRWRVEYPREPYRPWKYPPIQSGATLRARWNGHLSAPRVYRSGAPMSVSGVLGALTRTVHVTPAATVSMHGKVVLLQQLQGRRWVTIREARLAQVPSLDYGPLNHEATFPVRRGWMLRGVLPGRSAAPCYLESVTEPFRVW